MQNENDLKVLAQQKSIGATRTLWRYEQWLDNSYCYIERVSGVTERRRTAEHRERLTKNQR